MKPDYEHMREVINKDAFIQSLCVIADSAVAALAGCKVGDVVGCAVFSLAWDATDDKEELKRYPIFAYTIVEKVYGSQVVQPLWQTNDSFSDRNDRLEALNLVIDDFKEGTFNAIRNRYALTQRKALRSLIQAARGETHDARL